MSNTCICPNPTCKKKFLNYRNLLQHINKKPLCYNFFESTRFGIDLDSEDTDDNVDTPMEEHGNEASPADEEIENENKRKRTGDKKDDNDRSHSFFAPNIHNGEYEDEENDENDSTTKLDDGSSPLSRKELFEMMTPVNKLPPRIEFQFALFCALSHPSAPLYIYSYVMRLINAMINHPDNKSQFTTPFLTSRKSIQSKISQYFPSPDIVDLTYNSESKGNKFVTLPVVGFDPYQIILEEIQNPALFFEEN